MTKRVFNRFDPFMPVKIDNSNKLTADVLVNESEDFFEDFNKTTLSESLKFRAPRVKNGFTVIISKKAIGNENGLGEKLLEDFIYSLSNSFDLPQYLIFMNEAVLLLNNDSIESSISKLKKYGVNNLVSLESLNYFNHKINSTILIQATSGDITEKILFSKQLINL